MKGLRWKSEKRTGFIGFKSFSSVFFLFLWSIVGWKFLFDTFVSKIAGIDFISPTSGVYIAKNRSLLKFLWKLLKKFPSFLSPFIWYFSARDLRRCCCDSRQNFLINPANIKPPFRESLETRPHAQAILRWRFRSSYYLRSVRADRFELHTFIRIRRSTFNSTRIATLAIIEVLEGTGLHTSPTMRWFALTKPRLSRCRTHSRTFRPWITFSSILLY